MEVQARDLKVGQRISKDATVAEVRWLDGNDGSPPVLAAVPGVGAGIGIEVTLTNGLSAIFHPRHVFACHLTPPGYVIKDGPWMSSVSTNF